MDKQLQKDTALILEEALNKAKKGKHFHSNSLGPILQKKEDLGYDAHYRVMYALGFLQEEGYIKYNPDGTYSLFSKGYRFTNWAKVLEEEKLEKDKKKHDLEYVKKLNLDYKKNQRIVIGSAIIALVSAIASVVSAAC